MKDFLSLVLIVVLVGTVLFSGESTLISQEQAQRDALQAVGAGKVTLALKEKELGRIVWAVDVAGTNRESEVWVDAHNGAILQVLTEPRTHGSGYVSQQMAEQAALKAVGGGKVIEAQGDRRNGYRAWDVTITQPASEFDVYVDAHSASVLRVIKHNGSQTSRPIITKVQAVRSALQAVGGGRLLLIDLETTDNSRDWSVEVKAKNGTEYEAKVDAYTGGVSSIKVGG